MKRIDFTDCWMYGETGTDKLPVSLPHDATLHKGRRKNAASGRSGAYFESGCHEYEKSFFVPAEWADKTVLLECEGVYPTAEVSLNGNPIGGCAYGYSLFRVPLTGLRAGETNNLKIVADDSGQPNSRWYAGAGIYRPLYLLVGDCCHIVPDGVRITTKSIHPAVVTVDTELANGSDARVSVEIFDQGTCVAAGTGIHTEITIPDAQLWDAEHPKLYTAKVTVTKDGVAADTENVRFGIRRITWSAQGLFINDSSVLLKGGCIHSDNGILGACSYRESEWRRIARLKEYGFNAVRSSHNPLCRSALEACDALGMYVLDEAWDTWNKTKNPYDFGNGFEARFETDIRQMVGKDYNHPSVIMYSIGNEVTEPAKRAGVKLGRKIIETVKKQDSTRPVTAGINITLLLMSALPFDILAMFDQKEESEDTPAKDLPEKKHPAKKQMSSDQYNAMVQKQGRSMVSAASLPPADWVSRKILDSLDIAGYNYAMSRYEKEGKKHPGRIVLGTETYCQDINTTWPLVEKYPYLIGDFMWTAWDYLGEVGLGGWTYGEDRVGSERRYPWLLADTGALDILGNENAAAGLARTVWIRQKVPYIAVTPANKDIHMVNKAIWRGSNAIPYWSYEGCEGATCDVEIFSAASTAELLINGKSQGKQELKDCRTVFRVSYAPGELKAIAYDASGHAVGESFLHSAEGRRTVQIMQESKHTEDDILYYDVSIVGENGEIECNADQKLRITVEGGELLGFGSANPCTEEDYLSGVFTTYYGRAQAVVRRYTENVRLTFDVIDGISL